MLNQLSHRCADKTPIRGQNTDPRSTGPILIPCWRTYWPPLNWLEKVIRSTMIQDDLFSDAIKIICKWSISLVQIKARLHERAKMARIQQKLERFQQFLQRNSELLSVPCRVHRRLWTRCGTDKSSLFLCKNCWNRSSFCWIRAIFALSCKRSFKCKILFDIYSA